MPKKRTFFRVRSAPVTGIDICRVYPNIAKSTKHHKFFAKITFFRRVVDIIRKGHFNRNGAKWPPRKTKKKAHIRGSGFEMGYQTFKQ